MRAGLLLAVLSFALAGCGANNPPSCGDYVALKVTPTAASADHTAAAPGNQQQFASAGIPTISPGSASTCGLPQFIAVLQPQWTSSAPLSVTVSSAQDSTNGLATCLSATNGPVKLSATTGANSLAFNQTATVTLTCK